MLRNLFTIATRNILRQRFYALLNVIGLGIGLAVFLIISIYIDYQLSYDTFYKNSNRLYRIDQTFIWGDAYPTFGSTGPGVAQAVATDVPGVEKVTRVYAIGDQLVSVPSHAASVSYEEEGMLGVDSTFFDVFALKILKGNGATALNEPFSVVITESAAQQFFGSEEVLGQMLKIGNGRSETLFKVTGVVEDVPKNAHFTFNILASMSSFPEVRARNTTWYWSGFVTYAKLLPEASRADAEKALLDLPEQRAGEAYATVTSDGSPWHLYLVPVTDIWLHTENSPNRLGATSSMVYVYVLSAIAAMVLLLACVNYMNMATARSLKRAREVGIRKVMGAFKYHLLWQFLAESFILVVVSAALALLFTELSLDYFNGLTGLPPSATSLLGSAGMITLLVAIVVATTLLAGAYPAFYMSRFSPVSALKRQTGGGEKGKLLRNGLVVFQFSISITLIILSIVVYDQLTFLQNKDLGFDKNNLLIVPQVQRMDSAKRVSFTKEIAASPLVESVGLSTSVPPQVWDGDNFRGELAPENEVPVNYMNVSENYLQTLGVEVVYGRVFSDRFAGDSRSVVLNEKALEALGFPHSESVVGKKVHYYGSSGFTIIGVIKDFSFRALNNPIEPLAIFSYGAPIFHQNTHYLSIKIKERHDAPDGANDFTAFLSQKWSEFAPGLPLSYQFTDQVYFAAFEFEQRLGQLFSIFTALAIIIACMGLLGLAAYMAEVRLKEIGIRKVLGASVSQLILLMGKDFGKLIAIAFVISVPLAWWLGEAWLQSYRFRISISWEAFALAGLSAFVLAGLTVGYQSAKAAFANPTDVLHNE